MGSAAVPYTAERSKLTSGAWRSMSPEVSESNIPRRSPSTRRRSSRATDRDAVRSSSALRCTSPAARSEGESSASTTAGKVGACQGTRGVAACTASSMATRSSGTSGRESDAPQMAEITRTLSWTRVWGSLSWPRSSGLSRTPSSPGSGRSATGVTPAAAQSGPFSPLGSSIRAWRPKTSWRHT